MYSSRSERRLLKGQFCRPAESFPEKGVPAFIYWVPSEDADLGSTDPDTSCDLKGVQQLTQQSAVALLLGADDLCYWTLEVSGKCTC